MSGKKLRQSFYYASRGLVRMLLSQQNLKIHVIIAVLVIVASFVLQLATIDKTVILLMVGLALTVELVNSVFEHMFDLLHPKHHRSCEQDEAIEYMKDVLAGITLIVAIIAVIIGVLIFWPYLIS